MDIISVHIDLSKFADNRFLNFTGLKKSIFSSAEEALREAREDMINQVGMRYSQENTDRYAHALLLEVESDGMNLTLAYDEDYFVKLMETGLQPFDMKPTFLASDKAKISAKGNKYIRIPIGKKDGDVKVFTVSELSDPRSWHHPGLKALNLFENSVITDTVEEKMNESLVFKVVNLFTR